MRPRYTIHCDEDGENAELFNNGGRKGWKKRRLTAEQMSENFDIIL
jgi:hypothetical protein